MLVRATQINRIKNSKTAFCKRLTACTVQNELLWRQEFFFPKKVNYIKKSITKIRKRIGGGVQHFGRRLKLGKQISGRALRLLPFLGRFSQLWTGREEEVFSGVCLEDGPDVVEELLQLRLVRQRHFLDRPGREFRI